MPKISHIAPNSNSSHSESCENKMGTNVSVHFKKLNDMRVNLMAANFTPLPSHTVSSAKQTFNITGKVLMWHVSIVCSGRIVYIYFVKTRN